MGWRIENYIFSSSIVFYKIYNKNYCWWTQCYKIGLPYFVEIPTQTCYVSGLLNLYLGDKHRGVLNHADAEVHIQGYYYNYSGSCKTYSGDLNWLIDASRGGRKVHSDGCYLASFCVCLPPAVFLIIIRKLEITPRHEVSIKIAALVPRSYHFISEIGTNIWTRLSLPFYLVFASMHEYFYLEFGTAFAEFLIVVICVVRLTLTHLFFICMLVQVLRIFSTNAPGLAVIIMQFFIPVQSCT